MTNLWALPNGHYTVRVLNGTVTILYPTILNPPNPYDNWPEVGSTTEFYMQDGDWALLTADYLRRREAWLEQEKEKNEAP